MVGILLGLVLLIVLAYRGWSIIWIAPICAGVVAVFGGLDLLDAYTNTYMQGFVDFTKNWFPVFMLGAIFGKLMEFSGMAQSVAEGIIKVFGEKQAIIGVIMASAVLAYGGISVFVVVFAVYPLAVSMFRQADIPRKLMPATIITGMMTFAMTALPGTPQIQNLIPTAYFNTTAAAAPVMGLAASLVMGGVAYFYLKKREKNLKKAGYGFHELEKDSEAKGKLIDKPPHILLSLLPLVSVIITLNILYWDIVVCLLVGILLIILFSLNQIKGLIPSLNQGATDSVMAMINTSAAVGFGTVVGVVPGFQKLSDYILGIEANPLISMAVASNLMSGATGSASGGLGITMEALGQKYNEIAATSGIAPEAFHRIASIASGGLDALPHNGAVITILIVTGLTHKESYKDIAVVAIVFPILALIPAILLASVGIY
ncbi:citrate transporter [Oceanobacillus oncorhynchi subsp. incaldanensis]|uniref:Citrate transporter n=2 Tax=Oceanobacillus TaxID=182709 RepID=A0A0A1MSB7_9BACI|nr:GntP family permease [Oceanobacillus oncorhynchi]MDM8099907.1 GntP family permease [Oceanobacillus oncorhynchi]UUI40445.1 GntP family permease [Oceanobacillus oncorhynchi]GIO18624.1 citrate transporter [Oceanobacillus oncorhynchi subsp. incaldanensis]CEI81866.1 Citrate transporter [Oceanobacillus oncorhynchi]